MPNIRIGTALKFVSALLAVISVCAVCSASVAGERLLDVSGWKVVQRESGKVNYYTIVRDSAMPFIRARYRPPYATTVLGFPVADDDRGAARSLRWQWRAMTLPQGGNECEHGKGDSAAVVYVTWKRGLKWYTLKYVWSAIGPKGAVCDRKRSLFSAQDTIILESGGPTQSWVGEAIDLKSEFRNHFADGRADASVPDFIGIGIMTDGDQTRSESAADYADFVLSR
jgi:hypothetical protein